MSDEQSKSGEKQTRKVGITDGNLEPNVSFDLGIKKPSTQFSIHQNVANQDHLPPKEHHVVSFPAQSAGAKLFGHQSAAQHQNSRPSGKIKSKPHSPPRTPGNGWGFRFWNLFEWLATSAAIFAILFLAVNYDSYSALFWNKLAQLNGQSGIPSNPYTEQEKQKVLRAAPESQKPLPIAHNVQEAKKQIPPLNLEVAPPDDRIIIPRIAKNVPIVKVSTEKLIQKDWAALESQIQEALRFGVVHFPGTAYPGDRGNVVITGHSSYFAWDPGRFKDVFALLHQVNVGDQIVVYHEQQKYYYEVYEKKVVKPSQVEVLTQKGDERLTLITCTPVGTALNRLIVLAKPIPQ